MEDSRNKIYGQRGRPYRETPHVAIKSDNPPKNYLRALGPPYRIIGFLNARNLLLPLQIGGPSEYGHESRAMGDFRKASLVIVVFYPKSGFFFSSHGKRHLGITPP